MKPRPKGAPQNLGKVIFIYSETAVGKTTSCFESLPKPIVLLCAEHRNAELSAQAANIPEFDENGNLNWMIYEYTTFQELMDFLHNIDKHVLEDYQIDFETGVQSVVVDGITQLMNNLSEEIQDIAAESRDTSAKAFILDVKLSKEGYGALGNHMIRLMTPLVKLSQRRKFVVLNSLLEEEDQGWKEEKRAVPALAGGMYIKAFPGMCDLIGLAERRYEDVIGKDPKTGKDVVVDRKLVFPPWVKFENGYNEKGVKENFLCKWSGKRPTINGEPLPLIHCPLDFENILGVKKKATEQKKSVSKNTTKDAESIQSTK